jgi:hypothetical protein
MLCCLNIYFSKMSDITIYKVECCSTGMCYVGSTKLPLPVRMYNHERQAHSNAKYHTRCREIILGGNYKVDVIETVTQEQKNERERYWIDQYKDTTVNKNIPTNIKAESKADYAKQYRDENPEKKKAYNTSYYEKHRDRLLNKIQCNVCGGNYCSLTRWSHEKTKRHQNALTEPGMTEEELNVLLERT